MDLQSEPVVTEPVPVIDNPLLPDPLTTPPDVEVSPDLLQDPTEYPIDNQAELAELDNYTPQTTDVIDHSFQPELVIAAEAIGDLLDLHHTIKTEGVSSHDMEGLRAIQKRLLDNRIGLPNVGLEEHKGTYMPTRSLLNQALGMESITAVVINTIKAWIRKLIEVIMSGYRWVKTLKQKHAVLDAQLVKARDTLIAVRAIYLKMNTLNGVMGSEATKAIKELSETALLRSDLARNTVTLYGFSHETAVREVKTAFTSAVETSDAIARRVKDLAELMDNKEIPSDDALCALNDLAGNIKCITEMQELSGDDEYLLKELGGDFWQQVERFRKVQVIDFDQLAKYYGQAADALGRIRSIRIDDPAQAERAQVVIDSITKAVDWLNQLVNFFNKCAQSQVAAARTYHTYYQSAIEILTLDFKSKAPSPVSVKEMAAMLNELNKLK